MINPLYLIINYYHRIYNYTFIDDKILEILNLLKYPCNLKNTENQIRRYFDNKYQLKLEDISNKKILSHFKYNEIIILHKFFNTNLNHKKARKFFNEILRRNNSIVRILLPYGFQNYLLAKIMIGIIKNNKIKIHYFNLLIFLIKYFSTEYFNRNYTNFIRNKNLNLIGGGPESDNFLKISRVRRNVVRLNEINPKNSFSDIIYYRSERLLFMKENNYLHELHHLDKWISLKIHLFKLSNKSNLTVNLNNIFNYGSPNAIQTVLFDLYINCAKSVKIYNTDLNLSKASMSGYRPTNMPLINNNIIFGEHPAHIQFLIIKMFYLINFIKVDSNKFFSINMSYRQFNIKNQNVWVNE